MNEYLIATHALPEHTVAALRTMLKTIEPMVGSRWQLRESMPADVLIAPYEALARLPQVARPGKLPVFIAVGGGEGSSGSAAPTQLTIAAATLPRPVTMPDLIEALRRAAHLVDEIRAPQEELKTVPLLEQFGGARKFSQSTLDARQRTTLRAAIFRLLQSPVAATVVDEQRQSIFSMLPGVGYTTRLRTADLAQRLYNNPPTLLIELSDVEQRLLSQARNFFPMVELEWTFWVTARAPWLRTELDRNAAYRLTRWPDFARLAHSHTEVQLASHLMSQPMTATTLKEKAGASEERTLNFLNAAFALGLLATNTPSITPRSAAQRAESASSVPSAPATPSALSTASTPSTPSGLAGLIAQVRRKFGFNPQRSPGQDSTS